MLTLSNVAISQGNKLLIENINLSVYQKHIVGVVGSNGCGKSSLFAAIKGLLEPSAGDISLPKDITLSALEQEVAATDESALMYVLSGKKCLYDTLKKLTQAEAVQDFDAMMKCHNTLHDIDGYSAESIAAKILNGLGFSPEQTQQSVASFSGGWRMRLNLAKCLFQQGELLLLDEPTNHLDMEAIYWLESFIKHYPGAVLIISHDRDFLDNTVNHIVHIDSMQLKSYKGNYSEFETLRAQQLVLQQAQYKKQQQSIAHAMKFVNRFRSKATKARQAQSRLKMINKMELIAPVIDALPFKFQFLPAAHMPSPMITLRRAQYGYDEKTVLKRIDFQLMPGERIGLLGINGAGKSTLIKGLCGDLDAQKGEVIRASGLSVGYFAQHQVDELPLEDNALALLQRLNDKGKTTTELSAFLGSFGFGRDQSLMPLTKFSGGEKARVALALIIWQRPNLLLLDEPTNHLDLEVRQALATALQQFDGSLILVTHDRYLMRSLVDELYIIEDGRLDVFDGTVEDYQQLQG